MLTAGRGDTKVWPRQALRGAVAGAGILIALGSSAGAARGAGAGTLRAAAPAVTPSRAAGTLGPLITIAQTWNNCGPASVAEVLSYWGVQRTQGEVQAVLRADGNARGMTPYGVPGYARGLGLSALLGVGGTTTLVKALISNGFPVIVSQWVSPTNHVGHYRPITAYDDRQGVFVSSDPYLGADHQITYSDFAGIWATRNQRFIVLYPPSRQALLTAVLASAGWNKTRAYAHDLAVQRARRDGSGLSGRMSALSMAWDEVALGHYAAARQDMARAKQQSASPVAVAWVVQELTTAVVAARG